MIRVEETAYPLPSPDMVIVPLNTAITDAGVVFRVRAVMSCSLVAAFGPQCELKVGSVSMEASEAGLSTSIPPK